MRFLLSVAVMLTASLPALAGGGLNSVPEPESLALVGIAAAAMLVARRRK